MWQQLVSVICLFALVQTGYMAVQREGNVKSPADLHRALFKNYDASVLPIKIPGERVPVTSSLQPIFIRELDEQKEIFVLDAWILMKWKDSALSWNPDQYSGIKSLNVPSKEVWRPDITSYGASPDKTLSPQVFTNVLLYSDGTVLWVPPLTVQARCPLNHSNFPNDIQVCSIPLGSWTYGSASIDLQLYNTTVEMKNFYDNNPQWRVIGAVVDRDDKIYPCCPDESYPTLNYNFTLQRKGSSAVRIGTSLSYFAAFLALLMFLLPPDSTHKVLLGAFSEVFLGIIALYLGTVVASPEGQLKATERLYPMMCAVAGALLLEMIIMNIARIMGPCRPSRCLVAIAKGCCQPLGVCVMRPYPGGDIKSESGYNDKPKKYSTTAQEEWNLIAMTLDRILFVISACAGIFCYKFCM